MRASATCGSRAKSSAHRPAPRLAAPGERSNTGFASFAWSLPRRAWSAIMSIAVSSGRSSHSVPAGRRYRTVGQPARLLHELAGSRALLAQRALVDRRARVALDVDQLASACMDDLPASHRAGGADRLGRLQPGDARPRRQRLPRHRAGTHPPIRGTTDERELSQPLERSRA
jgi:hypothetical protein